MKTNSPDLLLADDVLVLLSPIEIKAYPLFALIEGRLTEISEEITDNWWNYDKLCFIDNFSLWRTGCILIELRLFKGDGFGGFVLDVDWEVAYFFVISVKDFKIIELIISLSEDDGSMEQRVDFFWIVSELMFIVDFEGDGLIINEW